MSDRETPSEARERRSHEREVRADAAILGASGHLDVARGIYDRNREAWGEAP